MTTESDLRCQFNWNVNCTDEIRHCDSCGWCPEVIIQRKIKDSGAPMQCQVCDHKMICLEHKCFKADCKYYRTLYRDVINELEYRVV